MCANLFTDSPNGGIGLILMPSDISIVVKVNRVIQNHICNSKQNS